MKTLLRWVDREARAADSDKIRMFCLHDEYRRVLRRSGYFSVKSTMEFTVKVNGVAAAADFYAQTDALARHARRFGSGPVTGMTRACSSASTPRATTSGTCAPASTRPSRTSTRCPTLHALFERHGVRPTYVVTWPVASDERSQQVLRFLLLRGDCEIGAHHHAWETPPCTPDDVRRHPYASSLPLAQFEAQLAELTAAITRAVGERPVSYRSGSLRLRRQRTSPRSSATGTWSNRASRRCSTRRTRAARTSSTRRSRRISSPTTPRSGRERAACSRCPVPPRSTGACRHRSRVPTRVRRGRT